MTTKSKYLLLGLIMLESINIAHADYEVDGYYPMGFDAAFLYSDWSLGSQPLVPLETNAPYAGSYWKTFAFVRNSSSIPPGAGLVDVPVTAEVRSVNPLDKYYNKAVVHLTFQSVDWRSQYEYNVGLKVSKNSVFSNDRNADTALVSENEIDCSYVMKASNQGVYYIFDVPQRTPGDYYKFYIDIPSGGPQDDWIWLYEMFFFDTDESVIMEYDELQKICKVVALKGNLHLRGAEYDSTGNIVDSDITRESPNSDTAWTNEVRPQEIPYEVSAPKTRGNYIDIYAKAIKEGVHSPEKYMRLHGDGTITNIDDIVNDEVQASYPEEWYDLTGRRLVKPTSGIMIRRQGASVSRVIVK